MANITNNSLTDVQKEEIHIDEDIIITGIKKPKMENKLRSGIVNNGNQCFINATMQCLAVSPFIHAFIEKYKQEDKQLVEIISKFNLGNLKAWKIADAIKDILNSSNTTNPITEIEKRLLLYLSKNCEDFYIYICFKEIIISLQEKNKSIINNTKFLLVLKEITDKTGFSHLFNGEQNDPHEFMVYILDRVHAAKSSKVNIDLPTNYNKGNIYLRLYLEHFKKRYENDFSMFVRNFYYYMVNCIECNSCKNITYQVNPNDIMCINLPYEWRNMAEITLDDCLNEYFRVESIDYRCEKCNNLFDNRQDKKLLTRPKTLIIKLKRYTQLGNSLVKVNKFIKYPAILNMSKNICNSDDQPYELYGVINHVGFMDGGHYYSFIRDYSVANEDFNREWMVCNDTQVNRIDNEEALNSKNAYILFYHTMKQPNK
jgi:ubiquitin C-terminal hydrolase